MGSVGIRDLKNNLSRYLRRVQDGERIAVTDRGRVIAELRPPEADARSSNRYAELVASGLLRPAIEAGDPFEGWSTLGIRLPPGTAASLIDADRGD